MDSTISTNQSTIKMNASIIELLKTCGDAKAMELLSAVNKEWSQRYEFSELDGDTKRALADALCQILETPSTLDECRRECVELIRLLSREKSNIDRLIDERLIKDLVDLAGFGADGGEQQQSLAKDPNSEMGRQLSLEAQKALCNLIFQSEKGRRLCLGTECLRGLSDRLRQQHPENQAQQPGDYDRRFYDLRLLFLITALCPDARAKCRDAPFDNLTSLTNILDELFGRVQSKTGGGDRSRGASASGGETMSGGTSEQEINLMCETLKVIFNLILPYKMTEVSEAELIRLNRLADLMRDGLLLSGMDDAKKEEQRSNIVNLLAALPSPCYTRLTPPVDATSVAKPVSIYDGKNMEAVQVLLEFLDGRLEKPPREHLESLSPILTLLTDMARKHRHLRKYMRFKVLPPLTDVMNRPEVGTTLRNKLVRLMTAVTTEIKDLAADYLFELCNRSIDRLIKYTGFGNAAGMLSMHGLMGAAVSGQQQQQRNANREDDDDDSDTEEYARVRDQINPILGCYEPPRPDPMAGMSEEQKEYEAMKLVEQIDKLMKQGVVLPGRLGDDGKVHPVEHVLQLAEEAGRTGMLGRNRSSDEEDENQ